MIAKQRAQYMIGESVETEWLDEFDIALTTKTISSGDVLIRSEEPLPAKKCQRTEQTIDREYTSYTK